MTKIEAFFARYEEGVNSFDPEIICPQYTSEFLAAGPTGVACGRNDEEFRAAIAQRHELFEQIGFRRATVLGVEATPLDEWYTMAKVHWHMTFEKEPGRPLEFRFYTTYFVYDSGADLRVASWISHEDEERVMREAGLLPV